MSMLFLQAGLTSQSNGDPMISIGNDTCDLCSNCFTWPYRAFETLYSSLLCLVFLYDCVVHVTISLVLLSDYWDMDLIYQIYMEMLYLKLIESRRIRLQIYCLLTPLWDDWLLILVNVRRLLQLTSNATIRHQTAVFFWFSFCNS